jgi:hypothetical protein
MLDPFFKSKPNGYVAPIKITELFAELEQLAKAA